MCCSPKGRDTINNLLWESIYGIDIELKRGCVKQCQDRENWLKFAEMWMQTPEVKKQFDGIKTEILLEYMKGEYIKNCSTWNN